MVIIVSIIIKRDEFPNNSRTKSNYTFCFVVLTYSLKNTLPATGRPNLYLSANLLIENCERFVGNDLKC